jgi:hypothetical protein
MKSAIKRMKIKETHLDIEMKSAIKRMKIIESHLDRDEISHEKNEKKRNSP